MKDQQHNIHFVGQHLLRFFEEKRLPLYYWARKKSEGSAEVDFCFTYQGRMVGIEVKSGSITRSRSLIEFGKEIEESIRIRVSSQPLSQERYGIISLPFYLLPRLGAFL